MRRIAVLVLALVAAPAARAAPPAAAVQSSGARGPAPLAVTFAATGDAVSWHWDFGDGTSADGQTVPHTYARGRWTATLTATGETGETTTAQAAVAAYSLTLRAQPRATFGSAVRLRGRLTPAERGAVSVYQGSRLVATAQLARGAFAVTTRLRWKGVWYARYQRVRSHPRTIAMRPVLDAAIEGSGLVSTSLTLRARVQPAGPFHVRVTRDGRETFARTFRGAARIALATTTPGVVRVSLTAAGVRQVVQATVVEPSLGLGSHGASVRALEQRLRDLHYILRNVGELYAYDTYEAVLAFQKANGLARTGRVDAPLWLRLRAAHTPLPRYPGTHIEIDKRRQILLEVHAGAVTGVLHVSTGATGNTPVGTWHVYRRVTGWDWVLWYPMYFHGGFAIHGYPTVPPWPASHGCVRIPMWAAPALFSRYTYGTTVVVY